MGQSYCNCADNQTTVTTPKCSLYFQQLLTHFNIPDKQNLPYSSTDHISLSNIKHLPPKYTELLMYLYHSNVKYVDPFFTQQNWLQEQNRKMEIYKGCRLSEMGIEKEKLGEQNMCTEENCRKQSKFCSVFLFLDKNYPKLCQKISPKYNKQTGLAICYLHINGFKEQILIDDLIPASKFASNVPIWILLLEKAFAKVLGCYDHIELFSMGQIFSQVTGIPYYFAGRKQSDVTFAKEKQNWEKVYLKSFNSFKDALKYDELLYLTNKFSNDVSVFGYRNNYALSSIKFSTQQHKVSVCRFSLQEKEILSLRLNQLNYKYRDQNKELFEYPSIFLAVFKQTSSQSLQLVGESHIFQNSIYLNSIYTELQKGNYFVYVKPLAYVSQLSLVIYAQKNIKIAEIFDRQKCKQFLSVKFIEKIRLQSFFYEQIGKNVFGSVHKHKNIIGIYFEDNYPKKKLKLRSNGCFFEEERLSLKRQIGLEEVRNRWIIVLISPSNNRFSHTYFDVV